MSVPDPWHEWHETSIRDDVLEQLFQNPVLNPGHVQHEHARVSPAPPLPGGGHDDSSSSSSSDDDAQRRKKKNNKKQKKGSYKVKNAEMRLPQYPNALTVQSWHRSVRTAAISACEKPERARAFVFSVEADEASFDSLAVSDSDWHRTLDAKLADVLLKVVKGDLARRLAVMGQRLAKHRLVLAGRQILFLIYRGFGKDAHQTDCTSYSHLEKMQGCKDIKGLETFLAVWDNLMLNFQTPPKLGHMYSAHLSKIRNIPGLLDLLKKMNRLPLDDPKKMYEALGEEWDFLIEGTRLEKQRKQLDQLYENGSVATAPAATPEEKAKLPRFYVRDGKPCPNGKGCASSH